MTDEQHPEGTPAPKTTITITDLADVRDGDTVTVEFAGGTFVGPVRATVFGGLEAGGRFVRETDGEQPESTRFVSATREVPAPAWPTAKHVWWDGEVWTRTSIADGIYETPDMVLSRRSALDPRSVAYRFAREAVPVKLFNAITGAEVVGRG